MEQALAAPSDVNRTSSALKTLLQKCTAQKTTNAHLLSKIQKISNSIQVCCRIRPLRSSELRNNEKVVVEPLSETEAGYYDQKARQWKSFVYDKVFGPDQSQQDIFEEVRVCEERGDELERRVYWISTYMPDTSECNVAAAKLFAITNDTNAPSIATRFARRRFSWDERGLGSPILVWSKF